MAVLRHAEHPVPRSLFFTPAVGLDGPAEDGDPSLQRLHALASDSTRLERILADLVHDGLAESSAAGLKLPG